MEDGVDREYVDWLRQVQGPPALFDTPEEAALAGWSRTPSARAHVTEVRQDGDKVVVVVQLDGGSPGFHDREIYTCEQWDNGKWWCQEGIQA